MAEKKKAAAAKPQAPAPAQAPDPTDEIRSKLLSRLAVAGGLVAALLAILAFFDYLATPPDDADVRVYSRPVPVAPKKEVSQPVTPATNLPEPPAPITSEVKPAEATPPAVAEAPAAPPPPVVAAAPDETRPVNELPRVGRHKAAAGKVVDSEAAPETRQPARMLTPRTYAVPTQPASVPAAPTAPRAKLPETPTDVTYPPSITPSEPRQPSARVVQVQPAPPVMPPALQRLFSGFLLQAGVFTNPQRAEELHAKLTLSGVPSTLETRVQVGPFRTRQEAEAAQEKLRELGIGTVLVPPKGSKH